MSRYSDIIPSSHMVAQPPVYRYPHQQLETGTRYDHWAQYGPPPTVPLSLYQEGPYSSHDHQSGPSRPVLSDIEVDGDRRYSKGRDYLRSLGDQMASLDLDRDHVGYKDGRPSISDKPLPRLPPPPSIPHRPMTDPSYRPDPDIANIPHDEPLQKTFRPSPYLVLPTLHRNPHSDPSSSTPRRHIPQPITGANSAPSTPLRKTPKSHRNPEDTIDLTCSPSSSSSSPISAVHSVNVTPRSPARIRKRATSEQPPTPSSATLHSQPRDRKDGKEGRAIKCAGYTRTGQPCKRLVKASAPLLSVLDLNIPESSLGPDDADPGEEVEGRYCKDHAGMICSQKGFYSRDRPGVWVDFDDWIPPELGQQTQTLLKMTMESKLTAKESPGFIYAYELKDLQTDRTSYFKVGRTDNVPRRIGQWTNQCTSKSPILRDIFPLPLPPSSPLTRKVTLTKSLLPGALSSGTLSSSARHPSSAVKRWERLIHLELADIASRECSEEWTKSEGVRGKCKDCGVGHKEIFPIPRESDMGQGGGEGKGQGQGKGGDCYQVVVEVICRWERFVRFVYGDQVVI